MRHPLLLDMAIHTFDAARLFMGRDATAVTCRAWNPPGSWYAHGSSAVATFEMDGGAVYTYRGSWCAEGLPTAWDADWRAIGTRGTARWDGASRPAAEVVDGDAGFLRPTRPLEPPAPDPAAPRGHEGVIREFVAAVLEGRAPETDGRDNIRSLAMALAAVESAERGGRVEVRV
jgi:predicted dehydrogenase